VSRPATERPLVRGLMAAFGRLRALCRFRTPGNRAAICKDATSRACTADWMGDPTIADILSDPIVQAVMAADGVDADALEAELRTMGRLIVRMRRRRRQSESHGSSSATGRPACRSCSSPQSSN
jgi:hypothetical protein